MIRDTHEKYPFLNTLLRTQLKRIGRSGPLVVVDIGAFDGLSCLRLIRGFKKVIVYALEPCPNSYKMLRKNVKTHPEIKTYRLAISGKDGKSIFFIVSPVGHQKISQSNSLYGDFTLGAVNEGRRKVPISTKTLNTFCKKEKIGDIHLLQMNCEGGEYKIFGDKSSWDVFDRVSIVSLVLHGKKSPFLSKQFKQRRRDINTFLRERGLSIVYGEPLDKMEVLPSGHVLQVWSRE